MPGAIYTSIKATTQHKFPVLASLRALRGEPGAKPGRCQSKECAVEANFLRAWLHPGELFKLKLATLNGVRYCNLHAYELSYESGIPIFHRRGQVLSYHSRLLSASDSLEEQPEIALRDVDAVIVGKFGAATRQPDRSILVTREGGEEIPTCCFDQAMRLISTRPGGKPLKAFPDTHSPDCPEEGMDADDPTRMSLIGAKA